MIRAHTLPGGLLAVCLLLCLSGPASADNAAIERERAALRQQFLAAKDSATKRQLLAKMRGLRLRGASAPSPSGSASVPTKGSAKPTTGGAAKPTKGPIRAADIEKRFGVDLGADGAAIVRDGYHGSRATQSVRDQVKSRPWTQRELGLIRDSLALMAPLLSPTDNVDRIARVNAAIWPTGSGKNPNYSIKNSIMGFWSPHERTLVLTDKADLPGHFKTPDNEFKATVIHEVAHGVLGNYDPRTGKTYAWTDDNPVMKEWKKAMGWTLSGTRRSTKSEPPPTHYGGTNAGEDLAESAAAYLLDKAAFQKSNPVRYAFMEKLFADARAYKATLK